MAHCKCECGNILSNVGFPNTLEGEIRGIFEYKSKDVWECENCGRLLIEVDEPTRKGCKKIKYYVPEDGLCGELFDIGTGEQLIEHLKYLWMRHKDVFNKFEEGSL